MWGSEGNDHLLWKLYIQLLEYAIPPLLSSSVLVAKNLDGENFFNPSLPEAFASFELLQTGLP